MMATSSPHGKVRIVSLAPNVTSILLELGAGRELVGVSKWCKDVADVGRRPQVGDCWKINIDEVMRLKPTVLIGSVPFASDTVAKILEQPVTFVAINPRSLADIERDIFILGRIASRSANAQKLIRKMRHEFEKVERAARSLLVNASRHATTSHALRHGTISAAFHPGTASNAYRQGAALNAFRPRTALNTLRHSTASNALRQATTSNPLRPDTASNAFRQGTTPNEFRPGTASNVLRPGATSNAFGPGTVSNAFRQGTASAVPKSSSTSGVSTPEVRPRVYCEAWPKPRISSPPWVAELVEIAGGRMAVTPGQRVTDEEVAAAKPDIIVLAWAASGDKSKPTSALRNPAWQDVPAITNRRVFVIRDELLNTPGPPLIEGAWELSKIIHGAPAKGAE